MRKFRKKPVVVEAMQWFKPGDHPKVVYPVPDPGGMGAIKTLEGWHLVAPGDWIICGVKGESYPCKPDIFEMTYDAVSELDELDMSIPAFLRAIATKIERGDLSMMRCIIVGEDPDGEILLYGRRVHGTDEMKVLWERIKSAWDLVVHNAIENATTYLRAP